MMRAWAATLLVAGVFTALTPGGRQASPAHAAQPREPDPSTPWRQVIPIPPGVRNPFPPDRRPMTDTRHVIVYLRP